MKTLNSRKLSVAQLLPHSNMEQLVQTQNTTLPEGFRTYIKEKTKKGIVGRPHFVKELGKQGDAEQKLLDLLELVWIKNRSLRRIARKYGTSYLTLYRLVVDMAPFKKGILEFLTKVPRRKTWLNVTTEISDYETVQAYINYAKREKVKTWKRIVKRASRCWRFLKYKNPVRWTADEVVSFLDTLTYGAQCNMLDAIRQVAPQLKEKGRGHELSTRRYREKLRCRKKDVFGKEVNMIMEALDSKRQKYNKTIFQIHVTLGAREGSSNLRSGLCGLSWDRFKKNFTRVDLYESKVRGGIWWRDCPLDLFFDDLPKQLKTLWKDRDRSIDKKLIIGGYRELMGIYKEIRQALAEYYEGKLDPSLFKELTTIRPHDSNKIHVNLLWEAGIPLEVIAGEYLGHSEGIGLTGRGWLDINTIKKHYLSLTQRSERFKRLLRQIHSYSHRFNGRN